MFNIKYKPINIYCLVIKTNLYYTLIKNKRWFKFNLQYHTHTLNILYENIITKPLIFKAPDKHKNKSVF